MLPAGSCMLVLKIPLLPPRTFTVETCSTLHARLQLHICTYATRRPRTEDALRMNKSLANCSPVGGERLTSTCQARVSRHVCLLLDTGHKPSSPTSTPLVQ